MKKIVLLLNDLAVLYGALALTLLLRYGLDDLPKQYHTHILPFSVLFPVWIFALFIANLYEERTLRNSRDFVARLAQAITIAAGLSILFFYLIPYFGIAPKTNLFLFIIVFAALEFGARYLFNHVIAGGSKKRLLLVGVNQESLDLARFITDNPQFGYTIAALVHVGQERLTDQNISTWPVMEDLSDVEQFIHTEHVDTVVISPQAYRMDEVIGIFYRTLAEKVSFANLATFTESVTGTVPLGAISQSWFLDNMTEGTKKSYEVIKRGMDIASAIILGVPTLIITPVIALAIVATSPGPILFRQRRTGYAGRTFNIIKFRTMRHDAEKKTGAVWAQENDPRVTVVGRLLRKTRIDELPQLWNILMGQMSLIGPRAERPEFDEQLSAQIPFYKERYLIKPGLSGWAQINYPYGSSLQDAIAKLEYDLYYIKHRSFILDVAIILKTITISLRRAGR